MAHDSLGAKNQPQYSGSGVPADAADLSELGNYAALVGNRKADTSTVRAGLSGGDVWPGLEFFETDTGLSYVYVSSSSGWLLIPSQRTNGTFGYSSGMSAISGSVNRLSLQGDEVHWHAAIQCSSNFAAGYTVGTLPAGFRPNDQVIVTASLPSGATPGVAEVLISAAGVVTLGGYVTTSTSNQLKFDTVFLND